MWTGVKLRALAAVIRGGVGGGASGCSPGLGHLPSGGLAGFWTRVRLLAAISWLALGYMPGRPANAHTALVSLQVGALFEHDAGGDHFCTARVVASPGAGPADHRRALHQRRQGRRLPPGHHVHPGLPGRPGASWRLCGRFTVGTSGSPWVTDFNLLMRTGNIVGVIGGCQSGGDTPAISYSPYLGEQVERPTVRRSRTRPPRPAPERAARAARETLRIRSGCRAAKVSLQDPRSARRGW